MTLLSRRDILTAAFAGIALPRVPTAASPPVPWIQNVCRGKATVQWKSTVRAQGRVEFSEDLNFGRYALPLVKEFPPSATNLPGTFYLYRAELEGLSPATDYRYRVNFDGSLLTPVEGYRLRTGGATTFNFVAFGDCGLGTNEQRYVAQLMEKESAALALITGDVVYMAGSYPEYEERFFPYYASMMRTVPFFPCPGNHDYGTGYLAPYLALHALPTEDVAAREQGRFYSFDFGNVHFVSLDTNATFIDAVAGNSTMLQWLEQDLAKSNLFWRVVFCHHPPYSWGIHATDKTLELERKYLVPIFDRHGVDVVFAGHEHSYMRSHPMRGGELVGSGGTVYVTTGGGGANLYPVFQGPGLAHGDSVYHYVRVEIQDAKLTARAIRADGREIDAFGLAPPPVVCGAFWEPQEVTATIGLDRPSVGIYGRRLSPITQRASGYPLPRHIGNVRVLMFGRPLPLLSVSDTKIEVQMPRPRGRAHLRLETDNGSVEILVSPGTPQPDPRCW